MSDYKGAALMLPALPKAKELARPTKATTPTGSARRWPTRDRRLHPFQIQPEGRDPA